MSAFRKHQRPPASALCFFLAACLFLVAVPGRIWADSASPAQCLERIGQAVAAANGQEFAELVDIDAIIDQGLDVFFSETRKPENAASLPPLLALMFSQAGGQGKGGETLRALLRGEARAFVLNGINSGAFAGRKVSGAASLGMLAPLFAEASMGRKEIRHAGKAEKDGQDWILPFTIHDFGNGQDYRVIGRFSARENGCRLTGLENMRQLLLIISGESQAG